MTGVVVGAGEPPGGSAETSTDWTPSSEPGTATSADPSARGVHSAVVGTGFPPGLSVHTW